MARVERPGGVEIHWEQRGEGPLVVLANLVLVNNLVTALVLSPLLLAVLYPRVRRVRLLYGDVVHRGGMCTATE